MTPPETKYAKSGDLHIAYQVVGSGPIPLLFVPTYAANPGLDEWRDEPLVDRAIQRIAAFSRLILFDPRGRGLSDPFSGISTLEEGTDDLIAVLDAAGIERAGVLAWSGSCFLSILFAAAHPDRTAGLVLYAPHALATWRPDLPSEQRSAAWENEVREFAKNWGTGGDLSEVAPSLAENENLHAWWARRQRAWLSPGSVHNYLQMFRDLDVRAILPTIRVPTLVLHRRDDPIVSAEDSLHVAAQIPNAAFVALDGRDHMPFAGDWGAIAAEIEEFFTGVRSSTEPDRVLATILFTDVVASTEKAAALGDAAWRHVLAAHSSTVTRLVDQFQGRLISVAGEECLATFDGPARGIRCALAIRDGLHEHGLEIRAGLHTGEIELIGSDIAGIAVHIGARVSALAGAGEVLVSSTVKDLVVGSGITFEDRGTHALKGVPDEWRIYAVSG
jgi:pimeloyl-ACP methyl ester carboxylesterase